MKILFLTIFLLVFSACGKQNSEEAVSEKPTPKKTINIINTTKVERKDFQQKLFYYGYVKARKSAEIQSYSEGILKKIFVKNGRKVKKGTQLFALEGSYKIKNEELGLQTETAEKDIIKTSPTAGYIQLRKLEGNAVGEGDILAVITDLDTLFVEVDIFERDLKFIKIGDDVTVGKKENSRNGKVYFIEPQKNTQTDTQKIGIIFSQNEPPQFFPGDFVQILFVLKNHPHSLAVPSLAVLQDEDETVVIVKTDTGYQKRKIMTGIKNDKFTEVLSGLKEDDIVVTNGAYELLNKNIVGKYIIED